MKKANFDTTYCTRKDCNIADKCQRHISNNEFDENEKYWFGNPSGLAGLDCLKQGLYIPREEG